MASLVTASANIRLTNEAKRSVCLVNNVYPDVEPETIGAFVSALETIYNNGPCNARMNVAYDIVR